jgi:cell division protein FtsB
MGVTERIWAALTSMIKLEDKVSQQSEALKAQQAKIESLTERVIRIESQLELFTSAALVKRIGRGGS